MIDQTWICHNKIGQVVAEYLKPLIKNEFVITNTQQFPSILNNVSLPEDEQDVSYDVESIFTNIPIRESTDFIYGEI